MTHTSGTWQPDLIGRAVEVLEADDRIRAAWLAGSFARGDADEFSDVDLHCVITDDSVAQMHEDWRRIADAIAPTVSLSPLPGLIGGVCLTADWRHFDLVMYPRSGFDLAAALDVRPLFDRDGLLPKAPVCAPIVGQPFFPADTVWLFFYFLGAFTVVIGRQEVALAAASAVNLRDACLIPLLLAERGVLRRTGQKRLRSLLSDEQDDLLRALPLGGHDASSAIDAVVALARAFIPRARALCDEVGAEWPHELERAALARFDGALGVRISDDSDTG